MSLRKTSQSARIAELEADNARLRAKQTELEDRLREVETSRAWSVTMLYWQLRDLIRAWLRSVRGPGVMFGAAVLEKASHTGDRIEFSGWCFWPGARRPITAEIRQGDHLVISAPCDLARADLGRFLPVMLSKGYLGCSLSAPAEALSGNEPVVMRLVNARGGWVRSADFTLAHLPDVTPAPPAPAMSISRSETRHRVKGGSRLLYCLPLVPEFDRWGAQIRAVNNMKYAHELGWDVMLWVRNIDGQESYISAIELLGIPVCGGLESALAPQHRLMPLETLLQNTRFDCAIIPWWQQAEVLLPVIRRCSPATKVLVDTLDLQFVNNARKIFSESQQGKPGILDAQYAGAMRGEINVYAQADLVISVSEHEAAFINDLTADRAKALVVRDAADFTAADRPFHERAGIVLVGNYHYGPNHDAAQFLLYDILPHLAPAILETHPVLLIGDGLDPQVAQAWSQIPGVQVLGWVPVVRPYLEQARIAIIPVRYGAGVKNKLIAAMAAGLPNVSTWIGAEGLDIQHEEHLLIANDPAQIAHEIERLLMDEPLWRRLSANSHTYARLHHSDEAIRAAMSAALKQVTGH